MKRHSSTSVHPLSPPRRSRLHGIFSLVGGLDFSRERESNQGHTGNTATKSLAKNKHIAFAGAGISRFVNKAGGPVTLVSCSSGLLFLLVVSVLRLRLQRPSSNLYFHFLRHGSISLRLHDENISNEFVSVPFITKIRRLPRQSNNPQFSGLLWCFANCNMPELRRGLLYYRGPMRFRLPFKGLGDCAMRSIHTVAR